MNVRGIYKTSLIDYPGKISAVVYTGGCNLRCRYCHNPELVEAGNSLELYPNDEVLAFLKKREMLIDGVTITGGEPTLAKNIDSFIETIRELSLEVKLDTNGLKPDVVERLLQKELLDYIAIDVKTSPENYSKLTNRETDFSQIIKTVDIVRASGLDYEIRTTCVPEYVTLEDLESIKNALGRVKKYCLQQFVSHVPLIDTSLEEKDPYSVRVLGEFKEFVASFADIVEVRGI
ncbi:MAG: anaerobic ribonucleoside-triphosphate reductase activating protein [bacterium]|nr:anaerobic ribonucleoside-triphosphate reductase activating protein [bacterium]